jgi:hypothetical protein
MGIVLASFGLWVLITWTAARSVGFSPVTTATWGRWDTGLYLQIADGGYSLFRCGSGSGFGPDDWCGTAGWFPGFPYAGRAVGLAGVDTPSALRLVTTAGHLAAFTTLWFGLLRRLEGRPSAVAAMGLAAVFPGSVYHGALFPISVAVAGFFGCLWLVRLRRWWWAGVAGALAVIAYPSGILLTVVCVVVALDRAVGNGSRRLRAAAAVGLPLAGAYVLVLANFDRAVDRWDAWFRVQAKYHYSPTFPYSAIWRQARSIWTDGDGSPWPIGAQTLLVLAIIGLSVAAASRSRRELEAVDRVCLVLVVALWIVPLTLGGQLSLYRAESLLVPAVVLVARLPARLVTAVALVATPIAFGMARLFFDSVLV